MSKHQLIPDVLYIGFQRAGTTFLRNYFELHPQIAWGRNAVYFMTDKFLEDKKKYFYLHNSKSTTAKIYIDVYEALAIGYLQADMDSWGVKDVIPNSPISSARNPGFFEIPRRIKSILPKAKIIVSIRNQVDWLRSNYVHHLNLLPRDRRSFTDFLSTREGKRLLRAGFFTSTVVAYQKYFGESQVHVITLERLELEPEDEIKRLCNFLEVDFVPYPVDLQRKNTSKPLAYKKMARAVSKVIQTPEHRILNRVASVSRNFISRWSHDPLSKREKSLIRSFYSIDNSSLAGILEIDLTLLNY